MYSDLYNNKDNLLLTAKIKDLFELSKTRNKPCFSNFLNENQIQAAQSSVKSKDKENMLFYGGFDNAQRAILGVFPDIADISENAFPITAIEFNYRKCDRLSHRDFLGSIMAQGVTRESVGDILIEEGRAVVFVKNDIADFLCNQIYKIGNSKVVINTNVSKMLPDAGVVDEIVLTVASMRIDVIVAAITGFSREKTSKLIMSGLVSLNGIVTQNVSVIVKEKNTLTIRKKGKFRVNNILGVTKKGRLRVSVSYFR